VHTEATTEASTLLYIGTPSERATDRQTDRQKEGETGREGEGRRGTGKTNLWTGGTEGAGEEGERERE
jgi:hypothetical protein